MSSTVAKTGVLHYPPPNFSYLEENLTRCTVPISLENAKFCTAMGIKRILNYSGKNLDVKVTSYCESKGIKIQDVNIHDPEFPWYDVPKFQDWIVLCLEDLISQYSHASTLIVGSTENFIDALIIACLRKMQDWSVMEIIAEFRFFTWPNRIHDFEQFIEYFNTELVDMVTLSPDFHTIHENIKAEEKKLIRRQSIKPTAITEESREQEDCLPSPSKQRSELASKSSEELEQYRIDTVLYNLFFNTPTKLISSESTFDPAISLLQDKDEDD